MGFKQTFFYPFKFIRRYPGILYSLSLLVFIPLILWYNTFYILNAFKRLTDLDLQNKAVLVANILETLIKEELKDPSLLQKKIEEIASKNPEIKELRVLIEERGGRFKIIASSFPEEINFRASDPALALAFSQNQPIANLLVDEQGFRLWNIIKPLSKDGEKLGLIALKFSLANVDRLTIEVTNRAYLMVILAIFGSLILILHHTRLFEYVTLSQKLKELDKAKDEFIRMATHELQNPISNIRGYISYLKEKIEGKLNEEEKEMLERVELSAKNLSNLVEDILEVARIEQGRLDLTPKLVNPLEITIEVLEELKGKAEEKGLNLKLIFEGEKRNVFLKVNPNRLRQILFNLVHNGIKYTPKGEVRVILRPDLNKKRYFIAVEDTGIGIPAEAQAKLFTKFFRVKTRETAGIPGTGLGLWIAKELTERMGGKILVESIEKVGTRFTLSFPLYLDKDK